MWNFCLNFTKTKERDTDSHKEIFWCQRYVTKNNRGAWKAKSQMHHIQKEKKKEKEKEKEGREKR